MSSVAITVRKKEEDASLVSFLLFCFVLKFLWTKNLEKSLVI